MALMVVDDAIIAASFFVFGSSSMALPRLSCALRFPLVLPLLAASLAVAAATPLPALNVDLSQTSVSGISSGAFMAVQFGVVHSAQVRGVAATAGGPYFCAGKDSWAGASVSRVIARCMQGDPGYPAKPIGDAEMRNMVSSTRSWAGWQLIDPLESLAQQKVWLFHGYNDGIVKAPVSDALYKWYREFVPAAQVFYKNETPAAHAQISAACGSAEAACQPCATTGGKFINSCRDEARPEQAYDAAGAALQLFYGPLQRTAASALAGSIREFDQRPYTQQGGKPVTPLKISLADSGYLYVPKACADGESCRLHVAFHGCQQQAGLIGRDFVEHAGFNEWADANRIVVLYPQTVAAVAPPATPFNPQGCWDWWGYNDYGWNMTGYYATRDGAQIASVWNMVKRIAAAAKSAPPVAPLRELRLQLVDASASQVALAWAPVPGAQSYRLLRDSQPLTTLAAGTVNSWVDNGLQAQTSYRYSLQALNVSGQPLAGSAELTVRTGKPAAACDPYFSLAKNSVVTRDNEPTTAVCP
ncbi:PHB depolymerase family esterase [Dechloromonas sp. ZY10]|uniref:extracellular catalytic domain type 2 short-chain-length polyhydroxyalkanoate depolymerase n=1 Tax=Dechloromonas aquae TaxID=2664436 RepID=UPI003F9F1C89